MGIESRDYVRDDDRPSFGFRPAPGDLWAIKFILIANGVVYLLQEMTRDPGIAQIHGGITEWLSLSLRNPRNPDEFQIIQVWRLVTYGFCHGSFNHILFNMFAFWVFGRSIEPIFGSREFLLFYLAAIVVSGACHVGLQAAQPGVPGVVGASGGVMAVVFLTAMIYPRMTVLLMFVFPVQLRFLAIGYALLDVLGVFQSGASQVAHFAHLGGAGFGVAYKYFQWRFSGLWDVLRMKFRRRVHRSRTKVKIYQPTEPPSQDLERQVDEILAKISEQGESSLTDKERKILSDASRHYRKR